jgi:hypothetical protein
MSVLSQFCLARWKSVDSITPTALVYNLSRLDHRIIYAKIVKFISHLRKCERSKMSFTNFFFCLISDSILTCSDDDETSNSMEFSKVRYTTHTQKNTFDL